MSYRVRLDLFWKELALFGVTLLLGIFLAYQYTANFGIDIVTFSSFSGYSWKDALFVFLFILAISFLFRFKKSSAIVLKTFLILVVFSGSRIAVGAIASFPWDLIFSLAIIIVFIAVHNVLVHNVGVILGIAGISSLVGVGIAPEVSVALLIILSFYDILAVYWTKHMVYLAQGMVASGAIFGFVIPFEFRDFFYNKHEARQKVGEKFMILGSGDIGLPLIMASSLVGISIWQAVVTASFSLGGLFVTHFIFVNQESRKPMAALPPIAALTIIGYLISQL